MHKSLSYCVLAAILISFAACSQKSGTISNKVIEVEILCVGDSSNNIQSLRTYAGSIEEAASASLSFMFGGQIKSVYVAEGDHVNAGKVLMQVDDVEANASLLTAKAQLSQAQDAYNRVKQVYEQGGVSEVKWVEIQTKLSQAQGVYDLAKKQVDNRTIKAPYSGIIGEVNGDVGDFLIPGQTAIKILNTNSLCAVFSVSENDINNFQVGDSVSVECTPINQIFKGVISEKSQIASRLAHTYTIKAQLSKSQDALSGMNCKVYITEQLNNNFVVPANVVQATRNGLCLWVVENSRAQRRKIESDGYVQNGVIISNGLNNGDSVIIAGFQKLYNGAAINIKNK